MEVAVLHLFKSKYNMQFGICKLSIVPVRILNSDKSEMVTQLIYGEIFLILEEECGRS